MLSKDQKNKTQNQPPKKLNQSQTLKKEGSTTFTANWFLQQSEKDMHQNEKLIWIVLVATIPRQT